MCGDDTSETFVLDCVPMHAIVLAAYYLRVVSSENNRFAIVNGLVRQPLRLKGSDDIIN
jgi:hypothetical protein